MARACLMWGISTRYRRWSWSEHFVKRKVANQGEYKTKSSTSPKFSIPSGKIMYSRHIYFTDFSEYGCDVKYFNLVRNIKLSVLDFNIFFRWEILWSGLCPGFILTEKFWIPIIVQWQSKFGLPHICLWFPPPFYNSLIIVCSEIDCFYHMSI